MMTVMLNKFKQLSTQVLAKAKTTAQEAAANAKQTPQDQYLVALDIGTEYVKALIGRVVPDSDDIEIVGVGRQHQSLSDMQAGAIADIQGVVANCDQALHQAEEQAGVSVRTAMIGIAGELVKGTTTTVRVTRKDPSKQLDLNEMQRIIKLVQERAEATAQQELAVELGGHEVNVRLVNSALVSIEIDNYPVTNPIGFQGKEVVVQLYTAFAPMIHIGALERTAAELDLDLLAVAAEPFAVSRSVIGDNPNATLSAILMDVGGGTTDIAVVNEGGVQGTKMFGIGGRAYTKGIERDLGLEFDEADKLKMSLDGGELPAKQQQEVEAALAKTLDVWMSGVDLALSEFDKLDHLPSRVFLCGGGSSLDMLMTRLKETEWYKGLPFTRKPIVQHIRPDQVVGIKDLTGDVRDHTFITAMGLLRVGMDTLHNSSGDTTGSVKDKLDKMLRV